MTDGRTFRNGKTISRCACHAWQKNGRTAATVARSHQMTIQYVPGAPTKPGPPIKPRFPGGPSCPLAPRGPDAPRKPRGPIVPCGPGNPGWPKTVTVNILNRFCRYLIWLIHSFTYNAVSSEILNLSRIF